MCGYIRWFVGSYKFIGYDNDILDEILMEKFAIIERETHTFTRTMEDGMVEEEKKEEKRWTYYWKCCEQDKYPKIIALCSKHNK